MVLEGGRVRRKSRPVVGRLPGSSMPKALALLKMLIVAEVLVTL